MASFGWSAGDVVATIALVNRIVQCVTSAHDARAHFQELLSELQALSRALYEISELTKLPGQTPEIEALKFASCSCGETLGRFYKKLQPFESALGTCSKQSKSKAALRMVRWELLVKKDVPELRSYLVAHVGSLNLRLSTALLKSSSIIQKGASRAAEQQDTQSKLLQQVTNQQAEMFQKIGLIPTIDTVPKIDSLLSIAIGVWKSQNELLSYLTKASQNIPTPDVDHTWASAPVKFEDALGRRFLIPSEYDWDKVEAVIQAQFKKGPGHAKVRSGDYELFDRRTGRSISEPNFFGLIPGSHIVMTILIGRYRSASHATECCARIGCRSSKVQAINSDTKAWSLTLTHVTDTLNSMECHGVYRKARKTLPRPMKPLPSDPVVSSRKSANEDIGGATDVRCYKNVSICFVELPATPTVFREKYPRMVPLTIKIPVNQRAEQTTMHTPVLKREPSSRATRIPSFLSVIRRRNTGKELSKPPQKVQERNSTGLRSMLQRQLSRRVAPLARLNFHSSAQEKLFSKQAKNIPDAIQSNDSLPIASSSADHAINEQQISHREDGTNPSRDSAGQDAVRNSSLEQPQARGSLKVPEKLLRLDPSDVVALPSNPNYWTMDRVQQFLVVHGFSMHWSTVFWDLDIQGSKFLDLDSGHGGHEKWGVMFQQIYRSLESEFLANGDFWVEEKVRGEGRRMRRLIRRVITQRPDVHPGLTTMGASDILSVEGSRAGAGVLIGGSPSLA